MSHERLDHSGSGAGLLGGFDSGQAPGKRTLTSALQRKASDAAPHPLMPGHEPAREVTSTGNGLSCEQSFVDSILSGPVQRQADGETADGTSVHEAAAAGVAGGGGSLPFLDQIQKSFGAHDVSGVSAHTDGAAAEASASIGAAAYATGNHVAFGRTPDLHTAAHEAAHVVQQRAGVHLKGGVGEEGDHHEQHADAVADAVVRGESAEGLLGEYEGGEESAESEGEMGEGDVQMKPFHRQPWPKYGKGKAEFFKSNDPASGVRMHSYAKNVTEPDGNQSRALQTLSFEHKEMIRKGDKRRIVIEGNASSDEKAGVAKGRAEAAQKMLQAKGVDDKYIIDVADYGTSRPRTNDKKGKVIDEKLAMINRYVNVRFEAAMDYGGTAPDDVEQDRKRILDREAPDKTSDPDDIQSKTDVSRSLVMMVVDSLEHSGVHGLGGFGLVNVFLEPFLAWMGVLGAIDDLNKSRARQAYRDGANYAAGHGVAQAYAGIGRIDYSGVASHVSTAREDTKYTPLEPAHAEAAYGRGAVTVAGGTYTDKKAVVTIGGIWNPAMEEAEKQTKFKLYDQLRAQGRKVDDADAIYGKIIGDVRIFVANKLSTEIRKALEKM